MFAHSKAAKKKILKRIFHLKSALRPHAHILVSKATAVLSAFWAKGRSIVFLVHSRAEDKIMIWTSKASKTENKIYLAILLVVCGLILLPSELGAFGFCWSRFHWIEHFFIHFRQL